MPWLELPGTFLQPGCLVPPAVCCLEIDLYPFDEQSLVQIDWGSPVCHENFFSIFPSGFGEFRQAIPTPGPSSMAGAAYCIRCLGNFLDQYGVQLATGLRRKRQQCTGISDGAGKLARSVEFRETERCIFHVVSSPLQD